MKNNFTSDLIRCLNKIFKNNIIQTELNAHYEEELSIHYQINKNQVVKIICKQVQVEEILTVKNANHKIVNCKAEELKKEYNKMLQSIEIKFNKFITNQSRCDESNIFQSIDESAASNEYIDNLYIIDRHDGDY